MRRWNGWGDESVEFALNDEALAFLAQRVGAGTPVADAGFAQACGQIEESRLPPHRLVDTSPEVRLRNALGQSLPDWLRLRYGVIGAAPDGVAYPESAQDVRDLLDYAQQFGVALIPQGGGTSVAGHLTAPGGLPSLAVNMTRMRQLMYLDTESQLATFGAGVLGPDLEAQLRARGYTLGHFPQSFEYSTLGGWVATRSSGQQSLRYGRIEQMFRGGSLETPAGTLHLPTFPASAAGPDLREMVLGSEGRLGILTEATVRVTPAPCYEAFHAVFFPDWASAETAVRQIVQAGLSLSMLRLSNPLETTTMLALAGHKKLISLLEGYLSLRGCGEGKCMLMIGVSGRKSLARVALREALALGAPHGGVHVGRYMGEKWKQNRFRNVYLRNAAWSHGYAIDTVETAVDWPRVEIMMRAVEKAATVALGQYGEQVHTYTHLSHLYAQGASVYTTFVYRLAGDYESDLARWKSLKRAASMAIVENGGTISHQHGVGSDHAPYLAAEKGRLGMSSLRALFEHVDPQRIMNPGKLLP
ncbi:alkyldihydroxyacetonephosphate synthase [Duganella sp. CF402]|uniref:FAD-binding oxidoreductase n=1 Tax=unclassified Duganella TaxID=2636909 RepID=UPI0008D726E0|nr:MULTISPECIES: FAD-binding oxidoreductase [unclassified Duganella]RZT09591.1 alkyldihydroxyacetonephosphate synthase [Duganella sp. BK701]SEL51014.1 alkyldihydroxyacetonephosphate synthase [Duganella sp. CF402]